MIGFTPAIAGQPLTIRSSEWNAVRQETFSPAGALGKSQQLQVRATETIDRWQPVEITDVAAEPTEVGSVPVFEVAPAASSATHWGIAQTGIASGQLGPVAFDGVTMARVDPSLAIGDFCGPTETGRLGAGLGGQILWIGAATSGASWAMVRLAAGGGGGGSLQVRVRITEIGTGSQAGLYGFDEATYTAGVGGASTSSSTISLVGGVTGRLNGTEELGNLPLIDVNRFRGLPIGFVVTAQQETTPNGLRWFCDAARGIIPPFSSANRGQQLQVSQDGNDMVWAHPSFVAGTI